MGKKKKPCPTQVVVFPQGNIKTKMPLIFFFYNFTLLRKPEINLKSDREILQVRQSWRMADVL